VAHLINKRKYDIIILDELCVALKLKLITLPEVIELLSKIPPRVECVLTGRCAPREIIELADLVSEIKEVKHYFRKGVKARRGIEC